MSTTEGLKEYSRQQHNLRERRREVYHEWVGLHMLDQNKKTKDVRQRMRALFALWVSLA